MIRKIINKAKSLIPSYQYKETLENLNHQIFFLNEQFEKFKTSKHFELENLLHRVEIYQPLYKIPLSLFNIETPAERETDDRCQVIEKYLSRDRIQSLRILDIGCSLGYASLYFADRKAIVTGIDYQVDNISICKHLSDLTGIQATFKLEDFNLDYVRRINHGEYDSAFMLSVIHHTIATFGLSYAQDMMVELLDKVPVLFTELAVKEEKTTAYWIDKMPKDELEVFAKVKGIEITKLGEFGNHLSKVKRPLYVIRKKTITVNNHIYKVKRFTWSAYRNSPIELPRSFYFSDKVFIKRYIWGNGLELNQMEILQEISAYKLLDQKVPSMPKMLDFEITPYYASIVFELINGDLLTNKIKSITPRQKTNIIKAILTTYIELEKLGLSHNDLRPWNIMVTKTGSAKLIDFGLTNKLPRENHFQAILAILLIMETKDLKAFDYSKSFETLPTEPGKYGAKFKTLANTILKATKNGVTKNLTFKRLLKDIKKS